MPIKSFAAFSEDNAPASTEEQVRAFRNLLIALIGSGALDAEIKKEFVKEEVHTYSAEHDEERYRTRIRALRQGLAALLKRDADLDDALLRKHGITKWDKTEAKRAATTAKQHTQRDRAKSGAR
ncbi:MAG: hypothetical protein ACKOEC_14315 [Acidimicrobiia bacterium]